MKRINIVLYIPVSKKRNTPYLGEKSANRHKEFISYFPWSVRFFLAIHENQYLGGDSFKPQFIRDWNNWKEHRWILIQADLILWMSWKVNSEKIYHNKIKDFCKDKTQIESIFPEYSFKSEICNSYSEILKKHENINSEIKVYKPCFGSRALGIVISDTLPSKSQLTWEYPYLIQEFMDTSAGFEWYSGVHDFRVIILNWKITGSFLRIAPNWIMTANVATWAEIIDFHWKIPDKIQTLINSVESYIAPRYPERYYSIDIGIGKSGEIKIFELNSNPMLSTPWIIQWLATHIIKNILKLS